MFSFASLPAPTHRLAGAASGNACAPGLWDSICCTEVSRVATQSPSSAEEPLPPSASPLSRGLRGPLPTAAGSVSFKRESEALGQLGVYLHAPLPLAFKVLV